MNKRTGKNSKSGYFCAAADRVIIPVYMFGEDLTAHLFGGEVVSQDENYRDFADVYIEGSNLALQVKMCNGRHASRPTAKQIETTKKNVEDFGFVVDPKHAFYCLVFYIAINGKTKKHHASSKLSSRKLDTLGRRTIVARELQYVYVIDVKLMHHLATSAEFPDLQRTGDVKVHADRKIRHYKDRVVLYLNRSFLKKLRSPSPETRNTNALKEVFGNDGWKIQEQRSHVRFFREDGLKFEKKLPITIIGGKKAVGTVGNLLLKQNGKKMALNQAQIS